MKFVLLQNLIVWEGLNLEDRSRALEESLTEAKERGVSSSTGPVRSTLMTQDAWSDSDDD